MTNTTPNATSLSTPAAGAAAAAGGGGNQHSHSHSNKPRNSNKPKKLTKQERRAKYTQLAREKQAADQARRRGRHLTCFHCRKMGHAVADCPQLLVSKSQQQKQQHKRNKKHQQTSSSSSSSCCFKCGSTDHALWQCPDLPERFSKGDDLRLAGELPYATCFVCHQKGHLSSQCTQNPNGIYVKGSGCCNVCGSKQHLASHCPEKDQNGDETKQNGRAGNGLLLEETNVEDLLEPEQQRQQESRPPGTKTLSNDTSQNRQAAKKVQPTKKRRVVKF